MKLKNLILLVTLWSSAQSCAQMVKHEQSVKYILAIRALMQDAKYKVEPFWHEMRNGLLAAKQSSNSKLQKSQVDSLQNQLTAVISDLDSNIEKIKAITEVDQDIDLTGKTLAYFIEMRKMQEESIPLVPQLLMNGIDKITPEQQAAANGFAEDAKAMQVKANALADLFLEFCKKYQINRDELEKSSMQQD